MRIKSLIKQVLLSNGLGRMVDYYKARYTHDDLGALRSEILSYFTNNPLLANEFRRELRHIRMYGVAVFPYSGLRAPERNPCQIYFDSGKGYYFVDADCRVYMRKEWGKCEAENYIRHIQNEQLPRSPHCYAAFDISVSAADTLADLGAAEGNFSVTHINTVKHCLLFEADASWCRALEYTFAPWNHKTEIIQGYIGSGPDHIKLSQYASRNISILKADIEGYEHEVLTEAGSLLDNHLLKHLIICTYHNQEDREKIHKILHDHSFDCEESKGYMLYYHAMTKLKPPYFRKCLVHGRRN